ncbi:receptor-like serine/threonine-protein kinase SD1-8 [Ipomoea triloba]|uniref:receptor-like serine/threonine-protein kinase SD1-8 n=1 Tax=Ipomoea triloba TaxID=35885 RepID=UPI00125D1DA0|nr:receptor-like serine/threonine-protein kinase SD1-8 [Ipomoea triloba]
MVQNLLCFCMESNTLSKGESLSGDQTLVSEDGTFELGFFSPGNSPTIYLAIWYKNRVNQTQRTSVWVANRQKPADKSKGDPSLKISHSGKLRVLMNLEVIWSSENEAMDAGVLLEAVLLNTGNLVLRERSNPENIIWQSFDDPTDTWLPGAKLGYNKLTGKSLQKLTAWRNGEDPSPGLFSVVAEEQQLFLKWNMSKEYQESGQLHGGTFSHFPELGYTLSFSSDTNENQTYFSYSVHKQDVLSRLVIDSSGELKQFMSQRANYNWTEVFTLPRKKSEIYGLCGGFGIYDNESVSSPCRCFQGFEPLNSTNDNTPAGCKRKSQLQCEKPENYGFQEILDVKWPDSSETHLGQSRNWCKSECQSICSCSAFAYNDNTCYLWHGDLLNAKLEHKNAPELNLKLSSSKIQEASPGGKKRVEVGIAVVVASAAVLLLASVIFYLCICCRQKEKKQSSEDLLSFDFDWGVSAMDHQTNGVNKMAKQSKDYDLPSFSYASVSVSTNNFSAENKLGEGGFGPVYKGKTFQGQEIAVKRLSRGSRQGLREFRNEIALTAKLQHRNLVRLLGCCTEQDERILVYEYLQNKSLDYFLFDPKRKEELQWETRVRIIEGIVQGLVYLHEYSRLRIIHRDLKASNILLDDEMNPKISDFGMARTFAGNNSESSTNRIAGTFGYMAPEYLVGGLFSVKSDVFSLGVLILEIISGKKNGGFNQSSSFNLPEYAWELWTSNRALELKDTSVGCSSASELMLRYINIGLLCVQQNPNDRPTMLNIVSMLSNEAAALPQPKRPAFSTHSSPPNKATESSNSAESFSINGLSISVLLPR